MVLLQSMLHRQNEYFMNTIKFLQFRPPPGFPRIPHLTSMANSTPDIKPCPRNDLTNYNCSLASPSGDSSGE